jgi:hypothetical protein
MKASLTNKHDAMLALSSALGVASLATNKRDKVHVFSSLGGKLLGFVDARYTTPSAESFEAFEERIKRFAAKKMPHEHNFSWQCVKLVLDEAQRRATSMWDNQLARHVARWLHDCSMGSGFLRLHVFNCVRIAPEIQVFHNVRSAEVSGQRGRLVDMNTLVSLTNLDRLDIKNADFCADMLPELDSFYVTGCKIERLVLPPGLRSLALQRCLFSKGVTLAGLVANRRLAKLDVRDQEFESCIPSELGMVSTLVDLRFMSSNMIGHIPTELGLLSRLRCFNAQCNKLSGPIPTELGNITSLEMLNLYDNRLTGCLPKELANCKLFRIDVQGNNLEATIPKELVYVRYICI